MNCSLMSRQYGNDLALPAKSPIKLTYFEMASIWQRVVTTPGLSCL